LKRTDSPIEPAAVIENARSWVGVRFRHQGRTRFGVDCLGFIAAVCSELGSTTPMMNLPPDYARAPQQQLLSTLQGLCRQIPLQPGALVLIQWPTVQFPSHAAIYTGSTIIHSYQAEGKVVEHGYRGPWVARTASIWALPEVVYQ
jgi:cell wall-associated NlpC family hydrolase